MNNYIYCYPSFLSNLDTFIMSKRPFKNKFITYYPHESTILVKLVKKNNKTYKDEKTLFCLNTISHNFTILYHNKKYYGIGGVSMIHDNLFHYGAFGKYKEGLYLLISDNAINWQEPKLIISRRSSLPNECCCFDSQPCFFYNDSDNLYYLYQRWNSSKGRRRLQLFKSDNIEDWTNTEAMEVKINIDINIYVAYIFKEKNSFYGIILYYVYKPESLKQQFLKKQIKCGLMKSENGINFKFINADLIDYIKYGWPVMNSLHNTDTKKYIYCCNQEGLISKHEIHLN